jgi:hypothetical protein
MTGRGQQRRVADLLLDEALGERLAPFRRPSLRQVPRPALDPPERLEARRAPGMLRMKLRPPRLTVEQQPEPTAPRRAHELRVQGHQIL